MTRNEIYNEIENMMGEVPSMFKRIPDDTIELEWGLFKKMQMEGNGMPGKMRHLVGLGVASAMKCPYCAYFHTENAKLLGATEEELEDAAHFAKSSMGWSAYLHGIQTDMEQFKKEVDQAVNFIQQEHLEEVNN